MDTEIRLIIIKKKKSYKKKKLQARFRSDILKQYFEIEKEESKEIVEIEKW